MLLLKELWAYLSPVLTQYRGRVALALGFLVAAKGGLIAIPFLLKAVVDRLDSDPLETTVLVIIGLVMAYGTARFLNTLFGELRDMLFGRVTERAMRRIGLQVFDHVLSLDIEYHLNRRTGGLARDIERGISGISFLMRFFIFNIAPTLLEIAVVIVILLSQYGGQYATVVFVSILAYATWSYRATQWRTEFVRKANEADSASNSRAVDSLLNYETVKTFTNEAFESERYDTALAEWEHARRSNRLSLFTLNGGQALIIALSQTLMLAMAAMDVRNGEISLGDFVLINQFMLQLFMPLGFLGFVYREIKASLANIEKLFGLLAITPKVQDGEQAPPLLVKGGGIQFKDVTFGYGPERQILTAFSLDVPPGQKIALVGSSGAGKSTIVKLLFRFYDPSTGHIVIDGQDIKDVTQESLREHIALVPQDCVLFNNTLAENIRYARPDASDADIARAIDAAHLTDFVNRLPKGLDTTVGERGLRLSGGEKQRVAIARAVLKNAPILIFDEATSSLDSASERAVTDAFDALSGNRTTLVIAHRLSTIIDADRIVVLEEGTIVEQGTHEALLAREGRYARLWYAQQRQSALPGGSPEQGV
jgi:ATP-binding cassette subfamily B protein